MKTASPLRFASLFSGCGGFDLGFIQAGFECVGAFDISEIALRVHSINLHSPVSLCDLSDGNTPKALPAGIDVLIAGPPCQGFSTAGKRNVDDSRNSLITAATKIACDVKPSLFLLENVRGALAGKHSKYLDSAAKKLAKHGYQVNQIEIRADQVGLPQIRRRVVLIASKKSLNFTYTEPVQKLSTLGEIFRHLPNDEATKRHNDLSGSRLLIASKIESGQKLSNVRRGPRAIHTWMIPEVFGKTTIRERQLLECILLLRRRERLRSMGDADPVSIRSLERSFGKDALQTTQSLLEKGYLRKIGRNRYDLRHTFNGKYRRLNIDGLSPTVDTRFGDPIYFVHPSENRGISIREAARIQGFPDSFHFEGTLRDQFTLIGNAVPPPMGYHLGELCRRRLTK